MSSLIRGPADFCGPPVSGLRAMANLLYRCFSYAEYAHYCWDLQGGRPFYTSAATSRWQHTQRADRLPHIIHAQFGQRRRGIDDDRLRAARVAQRRE